MKKTDYTCPYCPNEKLVIIEEPLDYGDLLLKVDIEGDFLKRKKKGAAIKFDVYQKDFYWCKQCKSRFPRAEGKLTPYKDRYKILSKCFLGGCGGRLVVYQDVVIGDLYLKGQGPNDVNIANGKRATVRKILEEVGLPEDELPDETLAILKEEGRFTGHLTLDQAGVCTKCKVVIPKELDWE